MKNLKMLALVPAAILAVACGPSNDKKVDDALNSDLTLAAQARPTTPMDSISAAERAYAAQGLAPVGYAPAAPVVAAPTKTRVVYRDRPVEAQLVPLLVERYVLRPGETDDHREAHQA